MKVRVETCAERGDGQFMVVYIGPDKKRHSVLSQFKVEEGKDVTVSNGEVVKP